MRLVVGVAREIAGAEAEAGVATEILAVAPVGIDQ
jgi:hypothetical protein